MLDNQRVNLMVYIPMFIPISNYVLPWLLVDGDISLNEKHPPTPGKKLPPFSESSQ
jgi:hypothetical protein